MPMMHLDATFGAAILAGMVVAFVGPTVVSFAMCQAWRKLKLKGNIAKWFLIFSVLLLCTVLVYIFFPVFIGFVVVAFPLIPFGCYAGHTLSLWSDSPKKIHMEMKVNPNHLAISRKTLLRVVSALLVVIYIGFFAHSRPYGCSTETHHFEGQPFEIELCRLSRSDEQIDRMSLRVYDYGRLVAERRFNFYTPPEEQSFNKIDYRDSEILYADVDVKRNDVAKNIALKMPPTKWDWFTANYWPF